MKFLFVVWNENIKIWIGKSDQISLHVRRADTIPHKQLGCRTT